MVEGPRDTCHVLRRSSAPAEPLEALLRRPPSGRAQPGERRIAEFNFPRRGRPMHMHPGASGVWLFTFLNRPVAGLEEVEADRVYRLGESVEPREIVYDRRLEDPLADRVAPSRALVDVDAATPAPTGGWSYAFLSRETAPGRLLVSRRSEGPDGRRMELRCFAVTAEPASAGFPEPGELRALLGASEPLDRAAAAWALGRLGGDAAGDPLERIGALLRETPDPAERAELALALLRLGGREGRGVLRAMLEDDAQAARWSAARALLRADPDPGDADAWASALGRGDADLDALAVTGLSRIGTAAVRAVVAASRARESGRRVAAARALGWIDDPRAEERLLQLVRDRETEVLEAAAVALTDPPRALLEEHHDEFARALDACRAKHDERGGRRLSVLAAHAKITDDAVLEALVLLAPEQPRAVWALSRLAGVELADAEACAAWWRDRARR